MTPFEPKGDQARWRTLYDLLTEHTVGDVVTYEAMGAVLDLHPDEERHPIQMALRRAAREYEEVDNRALDPIPNKGYRVVQPTEHLRLARKQQRKSHNALARGHSKIVHVDMSALEPETRKAFEVVGQAFAMQMEFIRRMDIRQKRLEDTVAVIGKQHDRSADEIEALRARLERLERNRDAGED